MARLEAEKEMDDVMVTVYICISCFLVVVAGLMSGLTLGLMSLDQVELEVLKRSGSAREKYLAAKIAPVIKNQHFLLVTLVLCNAAATEALPIFIDRLANPIVAVAVSVTVVLVFGEILPQSVCSRYGLLVGAYAAPLVRVLMVLAAPIAWPIGKLLDYVLGPDHTALFRRAQLKALVDLHSEHAGLGGTLSLDEINVIRGALDLTNKTAQRSCTPLEKIFMLSSDAILDDTTLATILESGHSRIPVYRDGSRSDIVGLILTKELLLVNPVDKLRVEELRMRPLPRLSADTPMYDMLRLFQTGRSHMALLVKSKRSQSQDLEQQRQTASGARAVSPTGSDPGHAELVSNDDLLECSEGMGEPIGIITIEDVIEELLQEEIVDETDQFIDNMQTSRVNAAVLARSLPPRLRRVLQSGAFTPRVGKLGAIRRNGPVRLLDPLQQGAAVVGRGPSTTAAIRQPLLNPNDARSDDYV